MPYEPELQAEMTAERAQVHKQIVLTGGNKQQRSNKKGGSSASRVHNHNRGKQDVMVLISLPSISKFCFSKFPLRCFIYFALILLSILSYLVYVVLILITSCFSFVPSLLH